MSNWESILSKAGGDWTRFVVKMVRERPDWEFTARLVLDRLIDDSVLHVRRVQGVQEDKLNYKSIPNKEKIFHFLKRDDRFIFVGRKKGHNLFKWAGDGDEAE